MPVPVAPAPPFPPFWAAQGPAWGPVLPPQNVRPGTVRAKPRRQWVTWPKITILTGLGVFALGWVVSVVWSIGNGIAGAFSCAFHGGASDCDRGWEHGIIPVAGPFLLLEEHALTGTVKTWTAITGGVEIAGLTVAAVGLAAHLGGAGVATPAPTAVTWRLAPIARPDGAGLALTGVF